MYLRFTFSVPKAVLSYCRGKVFDLMLLLLKMRRNWNCKIGDVEKIGIREKDRMLFVPSTPLLESRLRSQYTLSLQGCFISAENSAARSEYTILERSILDEQFSISGDGNYYK